MGDTLSLAQLQQAAATETRTVELADLGGAVTIRSLTRAECLAFAEVEASEAEALAIATGMVDPPVALEQARELVQQGKAGVGIKLARAILDLSGLGESFRS